jgi:hypothetical protein
VIVSLTAGRQLASPAAINGRAAVRVLGAGWHGNGDTAAYFVVELSPLQLGAAADSALTVGGRQATVHVFVPAGAALADAVAAESAAAAAVQAAVAAGGEACVARKVTTLEYVAHPALAAARAMIILLTAAASPALGAAAEVAAIQLPRAALREQVVHAARTLSAHAGLERHRALLRELVDEAAAASSAGAVTDAGLEGAVVRGLALAAPATSGGGRARTGVASGRGAAARASHGVVGGAGRVSRHAGGENAGDDGQRQPAHGVPVGTKRAASGYIELVLPRSSAFPEAHGCPAQTGPPLRLRSALERSQWRRQGWRHARRLRGVRGQGEGPVNEGFRVIALRARPADSVCQLDGGPVHCGSAENRATCLLTSAHGAGRPRILLPRSALAAPLCAHAAIAMAQVPAAGGANEYVS